MGGTEGQSKQLILINRSADSARRTPLPMAFLGHEKPRPRILTEDLGSGRQLEEYGSSCFGFLWLSSADPPALCAWTTVNLYWAVHAQTKYIKDKY